MSELRQRKHIISVIGKQIKHISRTLTKYITEHKKNTIAYTTIVGFIFLFILLSFIYLNTTEIKPIHGGEYREGLIGQPRFINPILATTDTDRTLTSLIFSGLAKKDTNLELQPDLAESISVNNEYKDYTVCLRNDAVFHDGEPLTLDDVLFTYETLKNPIFKNPLLERLKTVIISPIDEKCVVFMLENPSPEFLNLLTLGILPKHIWDEIAPEAFYIPDLSLKPIGSGPYKFALLGKNNSDEVITFYTLEKNEQFYDEQSEEQGSAKHGSYIQPPYLKNITLTFYNDFDTALNALQKHNIDGLGYTQKKDIDIIKRLNNYQLQLPSYTAVFLNLRDLLIQERAIRTALAHLTPKNEIFNKVLEGKGNIIHGPSSPTSFAFESDVVKYEYNPEIAEDVLVRAGWKKNTKGLWEKLGNVLEIKLTTPDQQNLLSTAKIIQSAWQKIGIRIKLITIPSNQITEVITTRNFQAFVYGILQSFGNDFYPLWHSSQIDRPGINITGFSNRRADELLEKAALSYDEKTRKKYYSEVQQVITQYTPALFLYSPTYTYTVDKKIKGIDIQSIIRPEDRFIGIENWYIKTKRVKKSTINHE